MQPKAKTNLVENIKVTLVATKRTQHRDEVRVSSEFSTIQEYNLNYSISIDSKASIIFWYIDNQFY